MNKSLDSNELLNDALEELRGGVNSLKYEENDPSAGNTSYLAIRDAITSYKESKDKEQLNKSINTIISELSPALKTHEGFIGMLGRFLVSIGNLLNFSYLKKKGESLLEGRKKTTEPFQSFKKIIDSLPETQPSVDTLLNKSGDLLEEAEQQFIKMFEQALMSQETIDGYVRKRQCVTLDGQHKSLTELDDAGFFDNEGMLTKDKQVDTRFLKEKDRCPEASDRELLVLSSLIYAISTKISETLLKEHIESLTKSMGAQSNILDMTRLQEGIIALNNPADSDAVKKYIEKFPVKETLEKLHTGTEEKVPKISP